MELGRGSEREGTQSKTGFQQSSEHECDDMPHASAGSIALTANCIQAFAEMDLDLPVFVALLSPIASHVSKHASRTETLKCHALLVSQAEMTPTIGITGKSECFQATIRQSTSTISSIGNVTCRGAGIDLVYPLSHSVPQVIVPKV